MEGESLSALCIGNVWKLLRPNAKLLTRARRRNHGGKKKTLKKKDIDSAASCGHKEVVQPEQANAAANSRKRHQERKKKTTRLHKKASWFVLYPNGIHRAFSHFASVLSLL
ncbi:hypothetical protein GDO78_006789 [Eleutherodactylus coqui]|uniref:Uncharacterized protein n=1 Tax=Eleutherodactylus coqui TaxID=57060 RepID=A0A8J6FH86_ELECQ|nr:hypothetical protein GDO78_006789 [Eleutherodactylus coqui]